MTSNDSTTTDTPLSAKISSAIDGAVNGAKNAAIYTVPAQINGKEIVFQDTFEVISPTTGKLLHYCSSASVSDAISAIEAAQAAFPAWRNTTPAARRSIFLKTADILEKRGKEFAQYMSEETGALDMFAGRFNIPVSAEQLRDIAGRIPSLVGTVPATGNPGTGAIVSKEPYGVILGIAPWYVKEPFKAG